MLTAAADGSLTSFDISGYASLQFATQGPCGAGMILDRAARQRSVPERRRVSTALFRLVRSGLSGFSRVG